MTSRLIRSPERPAQSFTVLRPPGGESVSTTVTGLYRQRAILLFDGVTIDSDQLDFEFTVPFDSDAEANEAEFTIYNLSYNTTNQLTQGGRMTVRAGYGSDLGVIFSGRISDKKITHDGSDRVITIKAIDGAGKSECEVEVSYCAGNTAQAILYDLAKRLGFPIVSFQPARDYTFDSEVTVDGSLMDAIEKYAGICDCAAYVCGGSMYIQPLSAGSGSFDLSVETGLLSVEEYEKERKNGEFRDTVRGWELEMLLNHRIQTGTRIDLQSRRANGSYYVQEGEHRYDGSDMITSVIAVEG